MYKGKRVKKDPFTTPTAILICTLVLFIFCVHITPAKEATTSEEATNPIMVEEVKEVITVEETTVVHDPIAELGWDYFRVVQVISGEFQTTSYECIWAGATAFYNAMDEYHTPEDRISEGWYNANPVALEDISEDVWKACSQVFLNHNLYEPIGNANVFYSKALIGYSEFHEEYCEPIATVDSIVFSHFDTSSYCDRCGVHYED